MNAWVYGVITGMFVMIFLFSIAVKIGKVIVVNKDQR